VRRGRLLDVVLLVAGLAFASLGQFYFAARREYVWDGLLFWGVALLALGLLLGRVMRQERGRPGWRLLSWIFRLPQTYKRRIHPLRVLAALGGVWLSLLAGWSARRRPQEADFTGLLWLWLVGVAWFPMAFWPSFFNSSTNFRRSTNSVAFRRPANSAASAVALVESLKGAWLRLSSWLRGRRVSLAGLVMLLLVALAVRAIDLEHIPANLGGDEGTYGVEGLAMLDGRLANPFATRWFGIPSMSFLAWGLSMRVFGETIAGLRMLSALFGAATVLSTFLLARELWGRRVAWFASVALTFGHYHMHFSRLGVNHIADGFFITLVMWLLVRALRSKRGIDERDIGQRDISFALAGMAMGLSLYGYYGARLVGVVAALYLAYRVVVEYRFLSRYGRSLVILAVAALVVFAPLLFHYVGHPDTVIARPRQVGLFSSGWLARERESTGRSAAGLILEQVWKSVSAFHYTLDPTFWYRPSIPLLDVVSGVLFVLGLAWATAHWRWPGNSLLLLWFWLALILGWVMTENPPSSMRLIVVAPAVALLVGLGLHWLLSLGRRLFGGGRRLWDAVASVCLVAVAAVNLHYYFVVYTPTRVYGNPTAEVATELGRYLAQRDDDYVVYFHGPPFMYWDFGSLHFLARDVEGVDVPPPEEAQSSLPDVRRGARFVFLPERRDEMESVRARYPDGIEVPAYSDANGRLLYVLYEVESRP